MILKRLFETYHLEISPIILKEYKRLGLSKNEAWVLVGLISHISKNNTLSISKLSNSLDMDENKVAQVLEKLANKKFYTIDLVKGEDNKEKEVVNVDYTFKIIENLITNDSIEEKINEASSTIKKTILEIEKCFMRSLSSGELAKIKVWFANDEFTFTDIKQALTTLKERRNTSFKYLETYLNGLKNYGDVTTPDEDTINKLKVLFSSIK